MRQRPLAAGIGLLGFLAIAWGTSWPAMKTAVAHMPILSFRTVCLLASGPALLAIARWRGERLFVPPAERWPLVWVALFNITGWYVTSAAALQWIAAGRASIIAYTMPVWAALLAWPMLGERPTTQRLLALGLGIGALAALLGPAFGGLAESPLGALVMLVGSVSWAIGTLLLKRWRFSMSVLQLSGWQVVVGLVPILVAAVLFENMAEILRISPEIALLLLYIIAVPVTLGQVAWFKIVDLLPASVASLGSLIVPVIGVLSSALFLGEAVRVWDLAALGLVLGALSLVLLRR